MTKTQKEKIEEEIEDLQTQHWVLNNQYEECEDKHEGYAIEKEMEEIEDEIQKLLKEIE